MSWNKFLKLFIICGFRHTLTGVWVEITMKFTYTTFPIVTPSRVCELKYCNRRGASSEVLVTPSRVCELKFMVHGAKVTFTASHPHGCVSWNIEFECKHRVVPVTPSRVCELKSYSVYDENRVKSHTLTGVWVEILVACGHWRGGESHTLTGVWVEILFV